MTDAIQMALGMVIGWRSLVAINKMTRLTNHAIRVLHIVLATAAAGMALGPLFPSTASDTPKLIALGAYLLLQLADQRRPLDG